MSIFAKPRIVSVEIVHAPTVLQHGRTPVRVVVEGSGVVIVGDVRRRFRTRFDDVLLVEVRAQIVVRAISLAGSDARTVAIRALETAPMIPVLDFGVPAAPDVRVPSLHVSRSAIIPRVSLRGVSQ